VNRSNMPTRETEDLSKDGFHKKRLPSLAPKRRPPARQSITYRSAVSLAGPQLPSAGQADRRKLFRSFFITAYTQQPSAKPKTRYLLPPFFPSMSSAAPDGCILRNRSQRLPTCLAAKIHSVIFRNMTRLLIFVLCAGFACSHLYAQTNVWQPSPGHMQVPIWPGAVPDAQPVPGPEDATTVTNPLVAGRPWVLVDNVSQPTMTVYSPRATNTGVAVVVFPGGGYHELAIDLEGTEVADWLTSKGITCVLLKYRVPGSGPHYDRKLKRGVLPKAPTALEDAQRTMGLVRLRAAEWRIDPNKIGVLGFSAGGHLVAALSTHFERRLYPAVDAADKESCRPDFAVALYPGHLCSWPGKLDDKLELNPDIATHITRQTPSTFLLQNEDDHVDSVNDSLVYCIALQNAGVPVEMHSYAQGGHAFGLRPTKFPATRWPQLVETWLRTIGMIPE